MDGKIQVGESLLDYMKEVEKIQAKVKEAAYLAMDCRMNIMDAETYQGMALEPQQLFFCSLAEHLQKMILLYQASVSYLSNTYMTMYYSDEQLADYIIRRLEG